MKSIGISFYEKYERFQNEKLAAYIVSSIREWSTAGKAENAKFLLVKPSYEIGTFQESVCCSAYSIIKSPIFVCHQ